MTDFPCCDNGEHDDPKPWLNPATGERRAYSIWEGFIYAPRVDHEHGWLPKGKRNGETLWRCTGCGTTGVDDPNAGPLDVGIVPLADWSLPSREWRG